MPVDFRNIRTTSNRPYDAAMIARINNSLSYLPAKQRAYILGTIIEESGGDPLAKSANGTYQGLVQWSSDRYKIKSNDRDKELANQLQYLRNTLNDTTDHISWTNGGRGSGYNSFRDAYKAYNNPNSSLADGYRGFSFGYVRPQGKNDSYSNRLKVVQQVYDRIKGSSFNAPKLPPIVEQPDATRVARRYDDGGSLSTPRKWNDLSLKEMSDIMAVAVRHGITSLQDIRDKWNEFAEGGEMPDTVGEYADAIYQNSVEEPYGDPSSHYNNVDTELMQRLIPDSRGHYDDSVKLPNHPSSPVRGTFNGRYFDLTDKGMQNPNYTLFGLIDNGDADTTLRYNGSYVLPEVTVTPQGNYYDDTYNNIKIMPWDSKILNQHAYGGHLFKGGGKVSQRNQRAGYAVDYFVNKGLSREQAAGLVGNLVRESQMNPNALNADKHGGAHGLAQWRGARWTNLQKMYGKNPTFDNQLDYIWHELNTTHKEGLRRLKASKTVDDAARNAFGYYEFSRGPENAIAQMDYYNKKRGYNNGSGRRALNDGINNAWVAYGKASPKAKLGLNVNTPTLGHRRTLPQFDFESIGDEIADIGYNQPSSFNVSDALAQGLIPSNPTDYGTPVDYSSLIRTAEEPKEDEVFKDDKGMGLLTLMSNLGVFGEQKQEPLASYTPPKKNNPFVISAPTYNDTLLDDSWFAKGGRLYAPGGVMDNNDGQVINHEFTYDNPFEYMGNTYPTSRMIVDGVERQVFAGGDGTVWAIGDNNLPYKVLYQHELPEVVVKPSAEDTLKRRQKDYLTMSNDATAIANGQPLNPHLNERGIYGAMAHAAWDKEHPNLAAWRDVATTVPFAVAAYPFAAGLGDIAAATSVGQGLTNIMNMAATTARNSTWLPWVDAAISTPFVAHGVNNMLQGDFSPETAMEVTPMAQIFKPLTYVPKKALPQSSSSDNILNFGNVNDGTFVFRGFEDNPIKMHLQRAKAKGYDTSDIHVINLNEDTPERTAFLEDMAGDSSVPRESLLKIYLQHLDRNGHAGNIEGTHYIIHDGKAENMDARISHEIDHLLHVPETPVPEGTFYPRLTNLYGKRFTYDNNTEVAARGSQLHDYFGHTGTESLTEKELLYARDHYSKDTGLDNQISEMLWSTKDMKGLAKWLTKNATGLTIPILLGTTNAYKSK